jgi:hypothetical protein
LLLVLASVVVLRSESRRTHDQTLLSQIRDSPNLEGQVPIFITTSARTTVENTVSNSTSIVCMRIRCRINSFTESFPSSGRLFLLIKICCLAANVSSLFISRSLPRNGSISHNIMYCFTDILTK